jgi:hypothetical protein
MILIFEFKIILLSVQFMIFKKKIGLVKFRTHFWKAIFVPTFHLHRSVLCMLSPDHGRHPMFHDSNLYCVDGNINPWH